MSASKPIDFFDYIGGDEALKTAGRSVRSLKKDVEALAKTVGDDAGRITSAFDTIKAAVKGLQESGGRLNLANAEDKKLLQDYIKEVGLLKTEKQKLKETEAAQAAAMATLSAATKSQTDALKQQKEALRAAVAANDVEGQKRAAAEIRKTTQENLQLSKAVRGVNSEFTAAKGSYDALTLANAKLLSQLRALGNGLSADSKEAAAFRQQIAANTAQLTEFDKKLGQNFRNVGNYPAGLKAAGAGALDLVQNLSGVTIGLAGVAQGLNLVFDGNKQFSKDAVAVRKTTGQTAEEFDNLADSLKNLDTPTTLKGLTEIARVGGALGESKDDILDFTKSVDVAVQALGDDFSGGAEQIATELGKISNVFRKELGPDTAANILAIGSAVNELGAVGAATAPFLTDVALRTGAVSSQFNVGLKNGLAYAAVLEETGFSAEVSGTALNRLYSTLATRTEAAFRIAQKFSPSLTLKEFTKLVNTDFNAAIQLFLKGLNAGGKTTTELNGLLSTLKLQSGEAKNVIITLAQNTDLFAQRQKTANDQLRDATSLGKEAALANDTLAGSVDKLTNDVSNFFTSGAGGRFLKFFVDLERELLPITLAPFKAIGDGISFIQEQLGFTVKPQVDYTRAVVANTQALLKQAGAAETLLKSYAALEGNTKRTAEQELELAQLRDQLQAKFGTTSAKRIQQTIEQRKQQAAENKAGLQLDLIAYDTYIVDTQKRTAKLQEDARVAQAAFAGRFKLSAEGQKNVLEAAASSALANQLAGRSFPKEQIEAAKELNRTQSALAASLAQLTKEQQKAASIRAALAKLSTATPKPTAPPTDPGTLPEEKKKKALADVLKAELELQKFRLEQQAKDYDRQSENVANPDDVRTRAIEKAIAARKQIATLDQLEQIHAAELANAELVNGDKKLAKDRILINEQFLAKTKELDFNGRRAIVALRQATAEQLADIDKQQLDTEAKALETIGADENKSAAERQQALLDASARRIEIILIESDAKRRTAKGDVEALKKIQAEEDAAISEQQQKTRNPNADLANKDLDKKYRASELALEKSRATDLLTERQYHAAVIRLEDAYLAKKLENLKADSTKQQEAADLEVLINKRKNDQKAQDDEEARENRQRITQQVAEGVSIIESTYFELKLQRIEAEQQALQASQDQGLKNAGENEELKAKLAEEFDRKSRALRRKAAQVEKTQALFQVAINTAVQASQYTPLDPRFYLALANGIAQALVISSKPLPAFFTGRRGGEPVPLATVAERGPEIIHRAKTQKFEYVPEISYTSLERGDSVFTAAETSAMLSQATQQAALMRQSSAIGTSLEGTTQAIQAARVDATAGHQAAAVAAMAKALEKNSSALSRIKVLTVNVTGETTAAEIREGGSLVRSLNKRLLNYGG